MKVIIEHLRAGTVPHDMLEELLRAGVNFYEGNLPGRYLSPTKLMLTRGRLSHRQGCGPQVCIGAKKQGDDYTYR
jgi:hypothetical protein